MIAEFERDTEQYYEDRVSGPPVGNRDAPTPQRVRAKRQRRETQKAQENRETEAILREMQAGGGAAALSPSAKAPRRREGGSKPGAWRRRARGGGMGGMGGFGVRGGSSGPAYQPMALLPGEQRLHVECLFGEGRPMAKTGKPAAKLGGERWVLVEAGCLLKLCWLCAAAVGKDASLLSSAVTCRSRAGAFRCGRFNANNACSPLLCAGTHAELPVPQRYAVAVEDARARLA